MKQLDFLESATKIPERERERETYSTLHAFFGCQTGALAAVAVWICPRMWKRGRDRGVSKSAMKKDPGWGK